MNKIQIGIFGCALIAVCGTQFGTDKNLLIMLVIAFALIVLSDKKEG